MDVVSRFIPQTMFGGSKVPPKHLRDDISELLKDPIMTARHKQSRWCEN